MSGRGKTYFTPGTKQHSGEAQMDNNQAKSIAVGAGTAVAAFAAAVVLHPLIIPGIVVGGGYIGYKAIRDKKNGGPKQ
jgi:hypothetical protein